jgi:hypothetical protein
MEAIEGYVTCATCGDAWVLREVASRTGGVCSKCWREGRRTASLPIVADATTLSVDVRKPRRRRRGTRGSIDTRHRSEHARRRAKTRLAQLYPEVYEQLLAEERAALGMEPWPIEIAARHHGDASETLGTLAAYHRRTENGERDR